MAAARFRTWRAESHDLLLSAVNFDSTHVGAPFAGTVEAELLDPRGRTVAAWRPPAGGTGLLLPYNYGDATLDSLDLPVARLRPWTLRARVTGGDPRFASADVTLRLHARRYDPGMGGMINYVFVFPAAVLLLLSAALAFPLAGRGHRWPLAISGAAALAAVLLLL